MVVVGVSVIDAALEEPSVDDDDNVAVSEELDEVDGDEEDAGAAAVFSCADTDDAADDDEEDDEEEDEDAVEKEAGSELVSMVGFACRSSNSRSYRPTSHIWGVYFRTCIQEFN